MDGTQHRRIHFHAHIIFQIRHHRPNGQHHHLADAAIRSTNEKNETLSSSQYEVSQGILLELKDHYLHLEEFQYTYLKRRMINTSGTVTNDENISSR